LSQMLSSLQLDVALRPPSPPPFPPRRSSDLNTLASIRIAPPHTRLMSGLVLTSTASVSVWARCAMPETLAVEVSTKPLINLVWRSEEHTSALQSPAQLVCRHLLATIQPHASR